MREKLGAAKSAAAEAPAAGPEFPDDLAYLWGWFCEILSGVASNGFAPAQLSWSELADWCALTGERIEAWEARALIRLSALRVSILVEAEEVKRGRQGQD